MLVLIGGSGFIGSHICDMAAACDQPVAVVSRRGPEGRGTDGHLHVSLETFFSPEFNPVLKQATSVVYLAGKSVPGSNLDMPVAELDANVAPAMKAMSRVANFSPETRFIFLSSGGTVYGRGHDKPIPEAAPLVPISPYGMGKVQIEEAIKFYGRVHGLSYAILRVANPVGRWQRSNRQGLVGIAINSLVTGQPVTLFGDGCNQRDYFDADDLADLIMAIDQRPEVESGVWNVGSGIGMGELDIFNLISDIYGSRLKIEHAPARACDLRYAVVNPGKALKDFGWSCRRPIRSTIRNLIEVRLGRSHVRPYSKVTPDFPVQVANIAQS